MGQLYLKLVDNRVRVEAQGVELLGHHLYIVGVAMSDADHSVTAIEVEILLSVVIPDVTTLTLHNVYVK